MGATLPNADHESLPKDYPKEKRKQREAIWLSPPLNQEKGLRRAFQAGVPGGRFRPAFQNLVSKRNR